MSKILLVEDEEAVRKVLTEYVVRMGHEPLPAPDAVSALSFIKREKPDIAIVDFFLPDMVAVDLIRQVKHVFPHLPVIMITSFWNSKLAKMAIQYGASDFIPKPIDFSTLVETVDHRLREQRH